jgi:hypothetical protein
VDEAANSEDPRLQLFSKYINASDGHTIEEVVAAMANAYVYLARIIDASPDLIITGGEVMLMNVRDAVRMNSIKGESIQ